MTDPVSKFYNDDGTEFNPDLIPKPPPMHQLQERGYVRRRRNSLHLTRADQQGEDEFECEAFEPNDFDDEE